VIFGSLFAGIGGFDLGLERAGMECAWQVELDDYCQRVLAKHWPDVTRYHDVRECGAHNLEPVDLICGGLPCQPHSVAGKRRGAADDRNLWPEYRRIVAELRPRWVLGENVPGIITTMLDEVLSDLEGEGYACTTLVLPAVAFDAPHRRDRVFVVAHNARRGCDGRRLSVRPRRSRQATADVDRCGEDLADAHGSGLLQSRGNRGASIDADAEPSGDGWARWDAESDVGRVADGVPYRVDRLRALGNAVVPQVVEWIGRRILEMEDRDHA